MKKKRLYQSPKSSVFELRVFGSIAKGPNNPGGIIQQSKNNEGQQGARGQSFFDDEELDDGGYKKFQLWDSADSN